MLTKLSSKGQMVLPKAIREMARIEAGDTLEVGYVGGMIVLRKPEPLNTAKVRCFLREGRKMPEMSTEDEAAVAGAVSRVRHRASKG